MPRMGIGNDATKIYNMKRETKLTTLNMSLVPQTVIWLNFIGVGGGGGVGRWELITM